jgi:hypothetical protein
VKRRAFDARLSHRVPASRRGGVAVCVLIALVALQLVVATLVISGSRDADITEKSAAALRSQYAADGAMAMSLRELYVNNDEDGDGLAGTISNDGNASNNPLIGGARAGVSATTAGTDTTVTATGSNSTASRKMAAVVRSVASSGGGLRRGLLAEGWALASGPSNLAGVNWNTTPTVVGTVLDINFPNGGGQRRWTGGPNNRWAMRLSGKITVPQAGTWTFFTNSDDGSDLWINGTRVVNNDELHSAQTRSGTIVLTAGSHDFVARVFESSGESAMIVSWQGPGVATSTIIPPTAFSFDSTGLAHAVGHASVAVWGDGTATGSVVDAFDADVGLYGGGNVLENAAVVATNSTASNTFQMSDLAQIKGSVLVGTGGNPASVIATWSGSTITGTRTAQTSQSGVFFQTAPTLASAGALSSGATTAITSDRRYSSISLWNSGTITITGHVRLVVDGNLSLSNNARIVIDSGSSLTLYVGGHVSIWGDSAVNSGGLPSACFIVLTGNSSQFNMTDRAVCSAHVQGHATAASLSGNGAGVEFFGTMRVNTIQTSTKARLHLDVSGSAATGTTATRSILSWTDVP